MQRDGYGKLALAAATTVGFISVAAMHFRQIRKLNPPTDYSRDAIAPRIIRTESGRAGRIERFSRYVARQIGFGDGSEECPKFCKLVDEYLKKSEGFEGVMLAYFGDEPTAELLYVKLMEELDRCILSYFAFHWSKASSIITQVLSTDSDRKMLKDAVMAATRKRRFQRVTEDLKVKRLFSTLVKEMKAIGGTTPKGHLDCKDVMAPVAHSERSPVLLLMGGGMGAGKSTVLRDILQQPFWLEAATNAVVVEADEFKEMDVIYQALNSRGHHQDMLPTAELVHESSTAAASSLLVTALNDGRDVIMDGTLSWEPFVLQTIEMARNVHRSRYRMGVGEKVADDGTVTETYWEQVDQEEQNAEETERRPYRIELVGVVCDAYLAVVRGIRRAIATRRAVGVRSQLKSHKRFASAFPRYCQLVDNARLYCTNAVGGPPRLMAWKDGSNKLLIDPEEIGILSRLSGLNAEAESVYEVYQPASVISEAGSVWKDAVMLPTRGTLQLELKNAINRIEKSNMEQDVDSPPENN